MRFARNVPVKSKLKITPIFTEYATDAKPECSICHWFNFTRDFWTANKHQLPIAKNKKIRQTTRLSFFNSKSLIRSWRWHKSKQTVYSSWRMFTAISRKVAIDYYRLNSLANSKRHSLARQKLNVKIKSMRLCNWSKNWVRFRVEMMWSFSRSTKWVARSMISLAWSRNTTKILTLRSWGWNMLLTGRKKSSARNGRIRRTRGWRNRRMWCLRWSMSLVSSVNRTSTNMLLSTDGVTRPRLWAVFKKIKTNELNQILLDTGGWFATYSPGVRSISMEEGSSSESLSYF